MMTASYFKGIKAEFMTLMETPQRLQYDPFVQIVNSLSNQEDYWIPETGGGVREWLDTINLKELSDVKYSIINRDYYDGLRENRNAILDSQEYLGANTQTQINRIVANWQSFRVTLVDNLISQSTSLNAFDGTPFFATSRPNIAASLSAAGISNTSTGLGTSTTNVLDDIGYSGIGTGANAKASMLNFMDVNNMYYNDPNSRDFYVMAPVSMEDTFHRILDPTMSILNVAGSAVSNPYAGMAKILLYNTTTHNWILLNGSGAVKPFILQNRQDPEWFMDDNNKKKYVDFWYEARIGVGFGSPFQAFRVTNA